MSRIIHPRSPWPMRLLITSFLIIGNATATQAENDDPTLPSPMIADRLAPANPIAEGNRPAVHASPTSLPTLDLRLKGMVLRDPNNGTAIVTLGDSKMYFVTLRRMNLDDVKPLIRVDGIHLAVVGFSESSIILQNPETGQRFVVN